MRQEEKSQKVLSRVRLRVLLVLLIMVTIFSILWLVPASEPQELSTTIDPVHKTISTEEDTSSGSLALARFQNIVGDIRSGLETLPMYLNVAGLSFKYIYVQEGLRKEEIVDLFAKHLSWDEKEKSAFIADYSRTGIQSEGRYYPGNYIVYPKIGGIAMRHVMIERFQENVLSKYSPDIQDKVPVAKAIRIASIIQRESGGKRDMKIISGIIWNRIFKDSTLDIDATLQYIKGNPEDGWWPPVDPADKKIESPYNTYKNKGLPPGAIANPGLASIEAALNPIKTSCFFYLHDRWGNIHCSKTYKEHVANISRYY